MSGSARGRQVAGYLPALLLALHPVSAGALLLLRLEPLTLIAVALIESLLLGLLAAAAWPHAPVDDRDEPTDVDWRHDGFAVRWPAVPRAADPNEAVDMALAGGSIRLVGGLVALPAALVASGILPDIELGALLLTSTLAVASGVAQAMLLWPQRALLNRLWARREVAVVLDGRQLTVGDRRWARRPEDELVQDDRRLSLRRGGEQLWVPGPPGALYWLARQLKATAPAPDDGAAPTSIRSLARRP